MTVYYLGHAVELLSTPPDTRGYVECEWPGGKRYRHWPAQLTWTPWGDPIGT